MGNFLQRLAPDGSFVETFKPTNTEQNRTTGLLMANPHSLGRQYEYGQTEYDAWWATYKSRVTSLSGWGEMAGSSIGMGGLLNLGQKSIAKYLLPKLVARGITNRWHFLGLSSLILSGIVSTLMTAVNVGFRHGEVAPGQNFFTQTVSGILYSFPSMFIGIGLMQRFGFGITLIEDAVLEAGQGLLSTGIGCGLELTGFAPESKMAWHERWRMEICEGAFSMFGGRVAGRGVDYIKIVQTPHEPIVYGINHSSEPEEFESLKKLILQEYRQGARTIGLEMPPSLLNNRFLGNQASQIADYAQTLGMRIICLRTDDNWEMIMSIKFLFNSLNSEGVLERNRIVEAISHYEMEIRDFDRMDLNYGHPETFYAHRLHLRQLPQLQRALALYDAIGGDLGRFGNLYRQWFVERADREVLAVLRSDRPDIALVGSGHLPGIRSANGYRTRDVSKKFHHPALRQETNSPTIRKVILDWMGFHRDCAAADYVADYLATRVSGPQGDAWIERAIQIEPHFLTLVLRHIAKTKGWEGMTYLDPATDIQTMMMPSAEVSRRVEEVLQKAAHD